MVPGTPLHASAVRRELQVENRGDRPRLGGRRVQPEPSAFEDGRRYGFSRWRCSLPQTWIELARDKVGVGAAEPEGADAHDPRPAVRGPVTQLGVRVER